MSCTSWNLITEKFIKSVSRGELNVKIKIWKNADFKLLYFSWIDLSWSVEVTEVIAGWLNNILKLGSDQERCDTQSFHVLNCNLIAWKNSINDVDCNM